VSRWLETLLYRQIQLFVMFAELFLLDLLAHDQEQEEIFSCLKKGMEGGTINQLGRLIIVVLVKVLSQSLITKFGHIE
jgi:hypothetical protein